MMPIFQRDHELDPRNPEPTASLGELKAAIAVIALTVGGLTVASTIENSQEPTSCIEVDNSQNVVNCD